MDFDKVIRTVWAARVKPLDERKEQIQALLDALDGDTKERILDAQRAVLPRKIEDAEALGKFGLAADLRKELAAVEDRARQREGERSNLSRELEGVKRDRERAGTEVLDALFPQIRAETLTRAEEYVDALEGAWRALQWLERQSGCRLSITLHQNRLTPQPWDDTRKLCDRLRKWES